MLNLAFIFHMHQPYYKNLLTRESAVPWVRLHGIKDYLDMVLMLEKFPKVKQVFNVVPSLFEQIQDYVDGTVKDKYLELSYKPADLLTQEEKEFLLAKFFSINPEKCIAIHPRYYELFLKKKAKKEFSTADFLDLQVWFNLAWFDPSFRKSIPALKNAVAKARFFSEEDKRSVLDSQLGILKEILPTYKKYIAKGQIEVILSPYYHPILPLLFDTNIAKEPNPKTLLPSVRFSYPGDADAQINDAIEFFKEKFKIDPVGMWPSEEAVSDEILPLLIKSQIKWIVADEAILFKSMKSRKRNPGLLYQPHLLEREEGSLNIVFRDRNLSDLIGFVYHRWDAKAAVSDFISHLKNIADTYKGRDILVTIAMDGENAWEYYSNDGHDFLELLYAELSKAPFLKTTTITEYLKTHPPKNKIGYLAAGSWIYGEFTKWIGSYHKNRAWECLVKAREELEEINLKEKNELAIKQMRILEGSDWFWWYGEDESGDFDKLFRMHMLNFYNIIGKDPPEYLERSL